jgi:hypothetical protein
MALYKAIYITQILTKAFIEKYYIQSNKTLCVFKLTILENMRQQIPCVQQGANHSYRLL